MDTNDFNYGQTVSNSQSTFFFLSSIPIAGMCHVYVYRETCG